MGIFRRALRGRHAAANAATDAAAHAAFETELESAIAELGLAEEPPPAGSGPEGSLVSPAGSGPEDQQAEPVSPRPSNFSAEAVAASIAADAERFVATFPYAASPVPEWALDFTRASLTHIEAMLGALHDAGRLLPERLHQSIAVYLFETARREFGGRYLRFEGPDALVLLVGEPRAEVGVCAMSRVAARVANGPDDSIIHFYASIAPLIAEGAEITLR